MSDIPPDDLGKEIERLWAKVGSAQAQPYEPYAAVSEAPSGREVAWEAVSLLKRQHNHETRYWAEVLEAKERTARMAQERAALLEIEIARLREKLKTDQDRFLTEGLDNQSKAEAAVKALEAREAAFDKEQAALREMLDQMRKRMEAEQARSRQEREHSDGRERQHLEDLKDLQALAARREEESGKATDQAHRMGESLKEAKNALEKTLSELIRERQIREESEKERDKAIKKVGELEKHFEELSKIWEEERAQWRELWDRERSTWETQRSEFSAWEDKLRQERETWLAQVQAKEQDQAVFTAKISESLRESSEATSRLSKLMGGFNDVMEAGRAAARKTALIRLWKQVGAGALALAAAAGVWFYASALHFKALSTRSVEVGNPTALAYDGNYLWVSEWNGRLEAFDPQNPVSPARVVEPPKGEPFRPVGMVFGGGNLWTLDAAQARIVRHKAERPEQIVWSRPSPGPAPTALAFDGESLWSFDAANKALYRHGSDEGTFKAFPLDQEVVATAMAWAGGRLFIMDAKTRKLLVFEQKGSGLKLKGRYELTDAVAGLAPSGSAARAARRLWVLAGPAGDRSGHSLIEYGY